jgi:valyl-tRNA synthetase
MAKRILWFESIEAALELAKVKTSNVSLLTSDLRQDVDALDTWFSSWLWPMSVLAELQIPKRRLQILLPNNDLVTGPDILFSG